ncbi:RNB domain [seawater metagenome]|uniref:RNB domain n=1 Tax=seawater metagenome TaxID=1561972 RepID=A0A5E8CKS4_9ZZZZ
MSKIIINHLGFGFINENDKTVFIPKSNTNGARSEDIVEYEIINSEDNIGNITNIVHSKDNYYIVSHIWKKQYVLKNLDTFVKKQIYIDISEFNFVIKDIIRINNKNEIIENLGQYYGIGRYAYLCKKYDINRFIPEEDFELNNIIDDRIDLTNLNVFTIDPTSSKDFDDAISVRKEQDKYILGIHIADVSYFIKPKSQLDMLARQKMNSTYLNGLTIHMLPSKLSNDICSLVPGQKRKTVSLEIEYNLAGELINYKIQRTHIISKKRYTYDQVRKQIDNNNMDSNISLLYNLINILYPNITTAYNLPCVHISLNDLKKATSIELEPYDMAHIMIEKCMIIANEIISNHLNKKNMIFPYRTHPAPSLEKLEKYRQSLNHSNNKMYQEISKIKSYSNAYYAIENDGHYGLDITKYCHFTSPIRRYIDIVIHRILLNEYTYTTEELKEICKLSNEKEVASFKAESELIEINKKELIKESNEELDMLILDVFRTGIKVQIIKYMLEHTIHISNLSKNRLLFDKDNKKLYNSEFDEEIKIGQIIKLGFITK